MRGAKRTYSGTHGTRIYSRKLLLVTFRAYGYKMLLLKGRIDSVSTAGVSSVVGASGPTQKVKYFAPAPAIRWAIYPVARKKVLSMES